MIDYNDLSELEQIELVKQDGDSIKYIKNPSEAVKLEAVKKLEHYYKYDNYFIKQYIKSEKALELYNKINRMRNIII